MSIMPRDIHKEDVGKRGAGTSNKRSRTFCCEISPGHIHQGSNNQVNSLPDRQQDSIALSAKIGRNRQQCTRKDQQRDF